MGGTTMVMSVFINFFASHKADNLQFFVHFCKNLRKIALEGAG